MKEYVEVFNSDAAIYGGTGAVNTAPCKVEWIPSHGQESSVSIRIPPFGAVFMKGRGKLRAKPQPRKAKEIPAAGEPQSVKRTRKSAAERASAAAAEAPAAKEAPKKPGRRPAAKKAAAPEAKKTAAPAAAEKKSAPRGRKKKPSAAE